MNPGIFGLPAGIALAGGSSVRLRKPFAGDERFKDAIRLMQTSGTACKPQRLVAASRQFSGLNAMKCVASNGTQLVAVSVLVSGSSETVSTEIHSSPDGITWTARTTPSNAWQSVCWTGSRFLAVAQSNTTTAWSNDGITWTAGTSLPTAITAYGGVFAFKGRTFAFRGNGTGYYDSTDNGTTWSALKNFAVSVGLQPKNVIVTSEFVMVADSSVGAGTPGAITMTTDGVNWTTPAGIFSNSQAELTVAARPGLAVALMRGGGNSIVCSVSRDNFATASAFETVYATQSSHTLGGNVNASHPVYLVGGEVAGAALSGWGYNSLFSHLGPQPTGNRLFFIVKRTSNNGAAEYESFHLLHTTDGKRWFLEDAAFGQGSVCLQSISHGGNLALFATSCNSSTSNVNAIRCALLNTDFEELVYDIPV